jgi:hypothetical protein
MNIGKMDIFTIVFPEKKRKKITSNFIGEIYKWIKTFLPILKRNVYLYSVKTKRRK